MQELTITILENKKMTYPSNIVLVEGENLTTQVTVSAPSWVGLSIGCLITTPAGVMVDEFSADAPFALTNTMLDRRGYIRFEFVGYKITEDSKEEVTRTSHAVELPVRSARPRLGEISPEPLPDLISQVTNAKNTALTAALQADAARDSAAEIDAQARAAEAIRDSAEGGRVTAEGARVSAETTRGTNETTRVSAEGLRVTAETGRVTAESSRVSAETARAAFYAGFNAALALKADKAQEAWITPTLINGWEAYDTAIFPIGYYKDALGRVWLRGALKTGTANTVCFNLPAGYRPGKAAVFVSRTTLTTALGWVLPSGNVTAATGAYATYVALDGISFRAEA